MFNSVDNDIKLQFRALFQNSQAGAETILIFMVAVKYCALSLKLLIFRSIAITSGKSNVIDNVSDTENI